MNPQAWDMYAVSPQVWDQGARPASAIEVAERAAASQRQPNPRDAPITTTTTTTRIEQP